MSATMTELVWRQDEPNLVDVTIKVTEDAQASFTVNTENTEYLGMIAMRMARLEAEWTAFMAIVEQFKPVEVQGVEDKDSLREIDAKRKQAGDVVSAGMGTVFSTIPPTYQPDGYSGATEPSLAFEHMYDLTDEIPF